VRFRRAAVLGVVIPLLSLVAGFVLIQFVVQPACLRHFGELGACDLLTPDANLGIIGQLVVAVVLLVLAARRHQRVTLVYGAVACSIIWVILTCLFAAQWLSASP
jgi:hypothetical protein